MSHYFIDKQDPRVADLLRRLDTGKGIVQRIGNPATVGKCA